MIRPFSIPPGLLIVYPKDLIKAHLGTSVMDTEEHKANVGFNPENQLFPDFNASKTFE